MVLLSFFDRPMIFKCIEVILLSNIKIFGAFIPLPIGIIEKENDFKKKIFLYLTSLITVTIKFSPITSLQYLTLVVLVFGVAQLLNTFSINNKNIFYIGLFSVVFLNDMIWNAFDKILVYDYIIALIKGISVVLVHALFNNFSFSLKNLTEKDMLFTVAFLGVMLMGIGELKIFTLNVRDIVSILIVLSFALSSGVKYSALAGLILGTLNELTYPNMGTSIISYALGGMIAGLFKDKGKVYIIWGFLIGNSILAYYITGYNALVSHFLEIAVAGSVFYVMNRAEIVKLKVFEPAPSNLLCVGGVSNNVVSDLESSSGSFYSMSELIEDIEVEDSRYDLFDEIKEDICFNCSKYDECWDKNYDETMDRIFDVIEYMEEEDVENLEKVFSEDVCSNESEIMNKIRLRYGEYKGNKNNTFNEFKNCVSEQFKGFSEYITEIKQKFIDESSSSLEKRIVSSFQEENYELEKLDVKMSDEGCEVKLKAEGELPKVSFLLLANEILSKVLGKRMLATDERREVVVFKEYDKLKVQSFALTKKPKEAKVLGDSYKIINSENNKYMMLLSDGMGTGETANKISSSLIELFSGMARLGLNPGTVTNMISSFIQYISNTEKIVTLDTLSIDLLTGECDILKIGGAPTFIVRKEGVEIIYCDTLPLGILDKVEYLEEKRILEPGDIIVSISDGVLDSKRDLINKEYWISSFLRKLDIDEPQIIAEELMAKTVENYNDDVKDDVTIIVSKICE